MLQIQNSLLFPPFSFIVFSTVFHHFFHHGASILQNKLFLVFPLDIFLYTNPHKPSPGPAAERRQGRGRFGFNEAETSVPRVIAAAQEILDFLKSLQQSGSI
jgi:hypothetical protein